MIIDEKDRFWLTDEEVENYVLIFPPRAASEELTISEY